MKRFFIRALIVLLWALFGVPYFFILCMAAPAGLAASDGDPNINGLFLPFDWTPKYWKA